MVKAGDRIGPYTLINKLGRGAFGVVWLAEKRSLLFTSRVALKLPNDEDIDHELVRREASVWAHAAGHPNVLPIIDADVYDEQVVIVSEYAPDGSLAAWINRHGGKAPTVETAVRLIDGVLAGLEHLHSKSIIHRDLKPDNILLQGETPRLADFGIARVLKTTSPYTTMVSGTPQYMAPEAYRGRRNEQTDLWSVGVMLYQLVAGCWPFPHTDAPSLMYAVFSQEPEPLPSTTPGQLKQIITKSLEKEPERRYRDVWEMRADIQQFLQYHADFKNIGVDIRRLTPTVRDSAQTLAPTLRDDSLSQDVLSTSQEETLVDRQQESAIEFIGDDKAYLQWLSENPTGFVVNMAKAMSPNYMVLHKVACPHISSLESEYAGGFTERGYMKVCSHELEPLRVWVKEHGRPDGSFSRECGSCNPLAHSLTPNSTKQLQLEYWTELNEILRKSNSVVRLKEPRPHYAVTGFLSNSRTELVAAANTKDGRIAVGVWIHGHKDIFHFLQNEKDAIEREIAWRDPNNKQDFLWLENESQTVSDIWLRWHGANIKERERWQEYLEWHKKKLESFYKTFEPRLRNAHSQAIKAEPNYSWAPDARPVFNSTERDDDPKGLARIDEPVIAININQQYRYVESAEDLYNCTRGIWRLNRQRAEKARYAFAVYQGVIKEVYRIDRWIPASKETIEYWDKRSNAQGKYFPPEVNNGRSEFIGELAPEAIRETYIGQQLPKRHSQNPIRYFNC